MMPRANQSLESLLADPTIYAGDACPPAELLLQAERDRLPHDERALLERHVGSCPRCQAEDDLAARFESASRSGAIPSDLDFVLSRLEETPLTARRGTTPRPGDADASSWRTVSSWHPVTLATAAALVVGLGLFAFLIPRATPPELPTRAVEDPLRGFLVETVSPRGAIGSAPREMVWRPVPGAASYQIALDSAAGRVFQLRTELAAVDVPVEIQDQLVAHVTYAWRVVAYDHAGSVIGRSADTSFSLGRPPGTRRPPLRIGQ